MLYKSYLALSAQNHLTLGLYREGKCYVFGDPEEENRLRYDIGSVSKTVTAHLILKLQREGKLNIDHTIDRYLTLKKGNYPTIYQLLTHTAGYHHLTPVEVTLPRLLLHGYARKNPYESCTAKTVITCLERRRFWRPRVRYGYSDFATAILAVLAESVTKTPFSELFEDFIRADLGLGDTTLVEDPQTRHPPAAKGKKALPFWVWNRNNPYLAAGKLFACKGNKIFHTPLEYIVDADKLTVVSGGAEGNRLSGKVTQILDYGHIKYAKIDVNGQILTAAYNGNVGDSVDVLVPVEAVTIKDKSIDIIIV